MKNKPLMKITFIMYLAKKNIKRKVTQIILKKTLAHKCYLLK